MPLHMIFRAGSLMANMLMGMVLLGRRYTTNKYVSVLMITVGIATCTVMSATSRVSLKTGKAVFSEEGDKEAVEELLAALEAEQSERLKELMFGIGLLVFAMLLSARMGIYQVLIFSEILKRPGSDNSQISNKSLPRSSIWFYLLSPEPILTILGVIRYFLNGMLPITAQEVLYSRHGKHAKEALFYTHALPLPGFLLLGHDILRSFDSLTNLFDTFELKALEHMPGLHPHLRPTLPAPCTHHAPPACWQRHPPGEQNENNSTPQICIFNSALLLVPLHISRVRTYC